MCGLRGSRLANPIAWSLFQRVDCC
jgi:hypothetical protein